MRLGVLGGTFDPVHWGHLLIAEMARAALGLERVLFVPASDPPHKQAQFKSPAHHRQRLVELAIEDNSDFELSTVDLDRTGPHYTVDTIRLIREQHDLLADDCFFIIGADSLADLPTWRAPERLIGLCRLAVAHRPGYRPDPAALEARIPGLAAQLDWIEGPVFDVSSTLIRQRAAVGQSIRYCVPEPVRAYIRQHNLY